MTTSTTRRARTTQSRHDEQSGALVGTGTLLRFMLRRDRVRFPAWVLGLTLLLVYFASALGLVQAMNFGEALGRAGLGPAGSP